MCKYLATVQQVPLGVTRRDIDQVAAILALVFVVTFAGDAGRLAARLASEGDPARYR